MSQIKEIKAVILITLTSMSVITVEMQGTLKWDLKTPTDAHYVRSVLSLLVFMVRLLAAWLQTIGDC